MERLKARSFFDRSRTELLIDVRSPGEFSHAHIPGAVSIPLFNDEERKIVGTAYKQESREKAIRLGLDFFGPKMRPIVEQVDSLLSNNSRSLCVYCWRGGMRSGAIAWLLNLYGFKVTLLAGGYKAFRNLVLETFGQQLPLRVIGGYTGSGKTELLEQLSRSGEQIINLEEIASHKGSAFGNINMPPQPGQEMFENRLAARIFSLNHQSDIWIEDESQRIGLVNIPQAFWQQMRSSFIYFLDIPFDQRLSHIVEEYSALDKDRLLAAIGRISKRLGGLNAKTCIEALQQGRMVECFEVLLRYYDKYYLKALHNRENLQSLLKLIKAESVNAANVSKLLDHQPA